MIERYLALWGEAETLRFLEACERPIRTSIRVNTLKTPIDLLVKRLQSKGVVLEGVPWLAEGYYADFGSISPGSLFEHMLGFYYIQGVPSMTVSRVLNPQPGEMVMDIAAAPGGKTTHMAQMMENSGMIVSIDEDRVRIRSLQGNILRCGVNNTLVLRGDARRLEHLPFHPNRILLDAPCSGEGLIPLDPSRKTSRSMADIRYCADRQQDMLSSAAKVLAGGGSLVYSTCSIAPEENEFVIDDFLKKQPEMKIDDIAIDFGSQGYVRPFGIQLDKSLARARRLLPHEHKTEGFFICRMTKEG
ncbi:MAG: SAM-dependent tRNA/rRNA cytosine-C5 methylase [Candidatus Thorarchaeota archaeon]|nr:MAG: SAM-dependent tRNA/rRNA cytosine-C5 methylase [Candidatus Thorarchaeota archaeon]